MRKQVGVAPANATDAATKAYVDAIQAPTKWGTAIAGTVTVAADTAYVVTGTGRAITFPAAPADGTAITLVGVGTPISYTAYAGSGDTVFNPGMGSASSFYTPAFPGELITYLYSTTTKVWYPNSASNGIAVGGTSGQILTKKSSNAYDTQWTTGGLIPVGGTIGQALVKKTATDLDTQWAGGPAPLLNFNNVDKPASDLSTTYPPGLSQWTQSNTQANTNGWPCGSNYCSILTLRASDGGNGASQWVTSTTNSVQFCYYRSGNQNGWSPWIALIDVNPADTGWITLALAAGFTGQPVRYRELNGVIYWTGQVSGTFAAGSSQVVSSTGVPAGFRGAGTYVQRVCATSTSGAFARAYINSSSGALTIQIPSTASTVPTYVDLSGLSGYPADA